MYLLKEREFILHEEGSNKKAVYTPTTHNIIIKRVGIYFGFQNRIYTRAFVCVF